MINDKQKVMEELFQALISSYQIGLETSMRSSDVSLIVFIYCIMNVIKFIYIHSPDWIKSKKATINPINKKCFQYALTDTFYQEEIKKDMQRIRKNKSFINENNSEEINYPWGKDNWKKSRKIM